MVAPGRPGGPYDAAMDDVLRCAGCGLPVGLADDVVNVAGRRFHQMCVADHHVETSGRPSGPLARLRGWVNLGWGRSA